MKNNIDKLKAGILEFLKNIKNEVDDTKEASIILKRHLNKDKTLTEKDYKILKDQIYDTLKILGIGIPYILLPGASVLMPLILKLAEKYKIDLLPSNFKNNKNNENNTSNTL